jgi:hypothetical protein
VISDLFAGGAFDRGEALRVGVLFSSCLAYALQIERNKVRPAGSADRDHKALGSRTGIVAPGPVL